MVITHQTTRRMPPAIRSRPQMNTLPNQVPQKLTALEHPFLINKYTALYFKIMSMPFLEEGYAEKHHVIPKSMGGTNGKENLVRLTAKQHFVAHKLLTKMTVGKMRQKAEAAFRAVAIMKNPKAGKTLKILSAKEYEKLRKAHAQRSSERMKELWASPEFRAKMSVSQPKELRSKRAKAGKTAKSIEAQRKALTGRKHSEETKAKMREARLKRFATDPDYRSRCKIGLAKGLEVTRARMNDV